MSSSAVSSIQDWKNRVSAQAVAMEPLPPPFPGAGGIAQVARGVNARLESDLNALNRFGPFLFEAADSVNFTGDTVALLRAWHVAQAPSLAALVIFSAEQMRLQLPPDLIQGLLAAALLGELENTLPYHNNAHYKKVLLQLVRIISVHNGIYEGTPRTFDAKQIALMMIAACIHDLGHDGKGNTLKGIHYPGHIENRSFMAAKPALQAAGLDDAMLKDLRVMLLTTDVSPLGDPGNYMNQMKSAYRFHFLGERKGLQSLNLDGDLAPLQKNPKLTMMCLALHEADISTSAGLNYDVTKYETTIYGREIGEEQARPSHVIEFLDTVCQQRMLSNAAQELYAANMARIHALAEKDMEDGNHPFPPADHSGFILNEAPHKTIN